jgi:hypothetical protein
MQPAVALSAARPGTTAPKGRADRAFPPAPGKAGMRGGAYPEHYSLAIPRPDRSQILPAGESRRHRRYQSIA